MRTLAILLVISTVALAQDDGGAALFYKGFWLEQAEGKLDEAAALYGKLLRELPDAAEAPRALLGLVRIKVAKGEDASALVAELERRYPAAKDEIAGARRIAVREEFDPEFARDDTPVAAKLKNLLGQMSRGVGIVDEDRLFLIDLGSAAHPMLSYALRAPNALPAQTAATLLVHQRTPEAYAILASALLDDTALFRSAIVKALANAEDVPAVIIDALVKLCDRSPPRLRAETIETLVRFSGGAERDTVFAALTRALGDDDAGVRSAACGAIGSQNAPDAYVDAILTLAERQDGAFGAYRHKCLPLFADRAAFRERIERVLEPRSFRPGWLPDPPGHEAGAMLLARKVVNDFKKGNREGPVYDLARVAAQASPRAAGALLSAALDGDNTALYHHVLNGIGARDKGTYLAEERSRLLAKAIALAPAVNEHMRETVGLVLDALGVAPGDFPAILEGMKQRGARGFPAVLLITERLRRLGAQEAGALVECCRDDADAANLLAAGKVFAKEADSGIAFFRQVIPKVGPAAAPSLRALMPNPALAPLVVQRLLDAKEPGWGWHTGPEVRGWRWPEDAAAHGGPYAWGGIGWDRVRVRPLRDLLLPFVEDKRPEVAMAAAIAAAADPTAEGTNALRRALRSPVAWARQQALVELVRRTPDGEALLRDVAGRADLGKADRDAVEAALEGLKGPARVALTREFLSKGKDDWADLWYAYSELAPSECVELALSEATGAGGPEHVYRAVDVLTQVDDPRRMEVFRDVLKGRNILAIREVLGAVGDQYLVELGAEVLAQLRNPDDETRRLATEAIDKLKFYAEAKKAFEK